MAQKKLIVLGCGRIGATIARDLARDANLAVTVADSAADNLQCAAERAKTANLATLTADLSSAERVQDLVTDFDVVVGALPSRFGYQTLQAVIDAGKPYCDISFLIEDATELSERATSRGVTAVYDCGVAPGLANMIIGHCAAQLDETHNVVYYVGGLPHRRVWPFEYKAPFAPADVIEEYTRPARMIEHGQEVTRPALSEPELLDFPDVGTLEAFNTDGLRSLIHTVPAQNMREKTLRWPGHAELMRALRESGFFSQETLDVGGTAVRPLDLTSRLLFDAWRLDPGEREFTILRVVVEGLLASERVRFTYELYDEYDAATDEHSMARTTGFPCAIVARMLASGEYNNPGVHPPEILGRQSGMLDRIITELEQRGVTLSAKRETVA